MWRVLLPAAMLGVIWIAAYFLRPYVEQGPACCIFRVVTGKPCPTCGMTRATCALAHGEWAKAMGYHPLVVPFWGTLVAMLWAHIVLPLSKKTERWRRLSLWSFLGVVGAGLLLRAAEWLR